MDRINKIGRRKKAIARVYLGEGKGEVKVNGKDFKEYFPTVALQAKMDDPFLITETKGKYDVHVNVAGGGITGQAEATRLAISRALVDLNDEWRKALKDKGFLTRDPRMVERKKYGQRKARKKFQFSKR